MVKIFKKIKFELEKLIKKLINMFYNKMIVSTFIQKNA